MKLICVAFVLAVSFAQTFGDGNQEESPLADVSRGVAYADSARVRRVVPVNDQDASKTVSPVSRPRRETYARQVGLKEVTRQVGYAGYKPDTGVYAVFYPNYRPPFLEDPSFRESFPNEDLIASESFGLVPNPLVNDGAAMDPVVSELDEIPDDQDPGSDYAIVPVAVDKSTGEIVVPPSNINRRSGP